MADRSPRNGEYSEDEARSISRSRSKSLHSRSRSHSRQRAASKGSRSRSRGRRSASGSRRRSYSPRRSGSPPPRRRGRDRSRSPMSSRRRHQGNRDDPEPNRCLGVFGLSLSTREREIEDIFGKFGRMTKVQVVYDHHSGRSRGFAFVYYEELEDAIEAKERCNGTEIDGRPIRVDYSVTERAHTPTPGIYLGKPSRGGSIGGDRGGGSRYRGRSPSPYRRGGGGGRDYYRRSPSPYYRRSSRYSRSRSRSYSPRRY